MRTDKTPLSEASRHRGGPARPPGAGEKRGHTDTQPLYCNECLKYKRFNKQERNRGTRPDDAFGERERNNNGGEGD